METIGKAVTGQVTRASASSLLTDWTPPETIDWEDATPEEIKLLNTLHTEFRRAWKGERLRIVLAARTSLDDFTLADALTHVVRRRLRRSRRKVVSKVKTASAQLAQRHWADTNWLSLAHGDKLSPIDVQATAEEPRRVVRTTDPGIIPLVARTQVAYAVGDVGDDPYYKECADGIVSEQAAAVVDDDGTGNGAQGKLLAVINQESRVEAKFSPASAELLRQEAQATLAPLLHEYKALKGLRGSAFTWRPGPSGWGLREYLNGVLEEAKRVLEDRGALSRGTNNLHVSVWYADLDDRIVSWIASTGHSNGVEAREVVRFDDGKLLGQLVTAEEWSTRIWRRGGAVEHLNQSVHDEMGTLGSRLVVCPRLSAPGDVAPFRLVVQVDSGSPEADALLPDEADMHRVGQVVHDQVKGYLSLYPRRAAEEVRRAIFACRTLTDQWHATAATMQDVLRAEAVTLFARPCRKDRALHVIAATAPLTLDDGNDFALLNPQTRPSRSLVPSPLEVGDEESYVGTLAAHPGAIMLRASRQHSGKRLKACGYPVGASTKLSAALPRTVGSERRCVGCSLPNPSGGAASAVALAIRSTDRAMFKAWDAAALVAMLDAAAPVVRSWRDWAAVRLPEAEKRIENTRRAVRAVVNHLPALAQRLDLCGPDGKPVEPASLDRRLANTVSSALLDMSLAPLDSAAQRRQDPIPRTGSLKAFSREIAAAAFERACEEFGHNQYPVVQAAVLMEGRGAGGSLMHQVAYYHFDRNHCPRRGDKEDPRRLRVPGLGDNWGHFLDDGRVREFRTPDTAGGPIVAGFRVPFLAWIGRHPVRGALVLDLCAPDQYAPASRPGPFSPEFRADLLQLARRLTARWNASGSDVSHDDFVPSVSPQKFVERLCKHLKADALALHLQGVPTPWVASKDGAPPTPTLPNPKGAWSVPPVIFDRADRSGEVGPDTGAALWGVRQADDGHHVAILVPLYFGTVPVGHVIARWSDIDRAGFQEEPQTTRALWVRDATAAWSLWSWGWTAHGAAGVLQVEVDETDGVWTPEVRFHDHAPVKTLPRPGRQADAPLTSS